MDEAAETVEEDTSVQVNAESTDLTTILIE